MPTWDSAQYLKFYEPRLRPAKDLLARVELADVKHAADLGCGPGTSTELLYERWPDAEIIGVDSSDDMLKTAREKHPNRRWVRADAATWTPENPLDLVFANASFQWIPQHDSFLPRLIGHLREGGVLAVQMPGNEYSDIRRIIEESAAEILGSKAQNGHGALTVHRPEFYHDVLSPDCSRVDVWETRYWHPLPAASDITEWFGGSAMRPYLDQMSAAQKDHFIQLCTEGFAAEHPTRADGKVLMPILRIFFLAVR